MNAADGEVDFHGVEESYLIKGTMAVLAFGIHPSHPWYFHKLVPT